MSHVDDNYDPLELQTIKQKMTKLYPADTDLEKKLYLILRQYNAFEKSKLYELVRDSLDHFKDQVSATGDLYADLQEIIKADGKLVHSETKSLETLRKIIDHHVAINER